MAARCGRIDEARELMAQVQPYAARNADIARALAMLDILLGETDGPTLAAIESYHAQTVEDGLEHELPHVVSPQNRRRVRHRETQLLALGHFDAAGIEFLRIADGCAPTQLGAQLLKTRSKMLPRWGGEHVEHLAVVCALGLGDVLLFGRYLARLKDLASRVTVIVHQPLVSLLRNSLPAAMAVVTHQDCAGAFAAADAYIDHVLLPFVLGERYGEAVWLQADRPRTYGPGLHFGICWAGGMGNPNDALRSIPLRMLAPLLKLPGVSWHSLQVGPKADECPAHVINHASEIRDFLDTARLIAGLDLVITVDTSIANLAGAMGAPVAVLVEHEPDFRWSRSGESTPWFPSARVFRQERPGQWEPVIERVRGALIRTVG